MKEVFLKHFSNGGCICHFSCDKSKHEHVGDFNRPLKPIYEVRGCVGLL